MAEDADSTLRACRHCSCVKSTSEFVHHYGKPLHKCRACANAERRVKYAAREGQYAQRDSAEWKEKAKRNSAAQYGRHIWDESWLVANPTKVCTRCGIELPANPAWFRLATDRRGGLSSYCRCCEARYYDENRDRRLEGQRRYLQSRKETEPEKIRANRLNWQRNNHEKKRWHEKEWSSQNIAHERQKRIVSQNKRRARKKEAGGTFSIEHIEAMMQAQDGRCRYCSDKLTKYHVDHYIPLSRGGSNGPENLVLACPPCNLSKGGKMPWEWDNPRL